MKSMASGSRSSVPPTNRRKAIMSSDDELSSDEGRDFEEEYTNKESSEEEEALSAEDHRLFDAIANNAAAVVQQAIRDGANVNSFYSDVYTPLIKASECGYDQIIRILLDAGADARWRNDDGWSAIVAACISGHLSTAQLLINHDNDLLEIVNDSGSTPLLLDIIRDELSDIVQFLLDQGADANCVDRRDETALMHACSYNSLEIVRMLLASGADVEARDEVQQTALHHAASQGASEIALELILQHNANMFAVDKNGRTPFDAADSYEYWANVSEHLLERYGRKLTHNHGNIALHVLLQVAKYSFAEERTFHPPLDPFRIILPLGKLTLKHLGTLLHTLDPELIRNRDDTGKLPIHIACQTNAPLEVLALILQLDATTLHMADFTGALPIHLLCGTTAAAAAEYASVRYLVEQGGVGTLAARNRQGLLPLHVLCRSTYPLLPAVQYLIQSFPGSVAVQTNAGQYPFMVAACKLSSASLSVIYELVRASPGVVATTTATPATASAAATVRGQTAAHLQLVDLQHQVTHLNQRVAIAECTLKEQVMILTNQNRRLQELYHGLMRQLQQQPGNTGTKNKNKSENTTTFAD